MTDGGKKNDLFCWTLEKAYVTKFTPSNMDAEADSEPAIEEVELSYQSFSISSGGILDAIIDAIF
jgi:hypothetical protein